MDFAIYSMLDACKFRKGVKYKNRPFSNDELLRHFAGKVYCNCIELQYTICFRGHCNFFMSTPNSVAFLFLRVFVDERFTWREKM